MNGVESLKENLSKVFNLPQDAIDWLVMIYGIAQVFDDVADGDKVERSDLNDAIWNSLVGIPQNPFYFRNSHILTPIVASTILKWQASDTAERSGAADARSFIWRAGYYDLILIAIQIVHGHKTATEYSHHVMNLYGENLEDYLQEFNHA